MYERVPCGVKSNQTYFGKCAEEPPGTSLIGFVGLFGFWFVANEVPPIRNASTIITHV